jgi:uncharacterized membrane protein (DUF485 family)
MTKNNVDSENKSEIIFSKKRRSYLSRLISINFLFLFVGIVLLIKANFSFLGWLIFTVSLCIGALRTRGKAKFYISDILVNDQLLSIHYFEHYTYKKVCDKIEHVEMIILPVNEFKLKAYKLEIIALDKRIIQYSFFGWKYEDFIYAKSRLDTLRMLSSSPK